ISLTKYPSINGIIFNFIRIPLSLLVMYNNLRIEWIWVIISSLVICKGISLFILFYRKVHKNKLKYLLD
ncbi:MAG: MATE family efflux transporter, partial [Finegoldia magna]|nr:MATE family efflux transporter [Finegoldia magna]